MKISLARSIVHKFSTKVRSQVIAVLGGVLIARTIGPSAKGFVSYAKTAVNLVAVFFLGFRDAVMFQFGKQKLPARAVHGAVMRVVICVRAVVIPLLLIIAYVVPSQRKLAAAAARCPWRFIRSRQRLCFSIVAAAATTSLTYLLATVVLIVLFVRGTGFAAQRLPLVQRADFRHYADLLKEMLRTLRLRSA
jgi:hypothetical protein